MDFATFAGRLLSCCSIRPTEEPAPGVEMTFLEAVNMASPSQRRRKHVVFQLVGESPAREQVAVPMRVMIWSDDTAESITRSVKNFYGLYDADLSFATKDGIGLEPTFDSFGNDHTVYVRVVDPPPNNAKSKEDSAENGPKSQSQTQEELKDQYAKTSAKDEEESKACVTPRCVCGRPSNENMVHCDNDDCQNQWFHHDCVGIEKQPPTERLCPTCTQLPKDKIAKHDSGNDDDNRPPTAKARPPPASPNSNLVVAPNGSKATVDEDAITPAPLRIGDLGSEIQDTVKFQANVANARQDREEMYRRLRRPHEKKADGNVESQDTAAKVEKEPQVQTSAKGREKTAARRKLGKQGNGTVLPGQSVKQNGKVNGGRKMEGGAVP